MLRIQSMIIATAFGIGSFRCYDTSEITLAGVLHLLLLSIVGFYFTMQSDYGIIADSTLIASCLVLPSWHLLLNI
jgi:hypothetical protein